MGANLNNKFWTPERRAARRAAIKTSKANWREANPWIPESEYRQQIGWVLEKEFRASVEQGRRDRIEAEEEARYPELRDRCRKYGLSVRAYRLMDLAQGGRCAIAGCGRPHEVIDHCHLTDRVRGLLCSNCNSALGFLFEEEARIAGLLDYVRTKVR